MAIAAALASLFKKVRGQPDEAKKPGGTATQVPPEGPVPRLPSRPGPPTRRSPPRPMPPRRPVEGLPPVRVPPQPVPAPLGLPAEPPPRARTLEPQPPGVEIAPARPGAEITPRLPPVPERAVRITPAITDIRPIAAMADQPEPGRRVPAAVGPAQPAGPGVADWTRLLRQRTGLQAAFVLSELLAAPLALRPRDEA
jgi:hypothetical protein